MKKATVEITEIIEFYDGIVLNIVSPTTGNKYRLEDVLRKGLARSDLRWDGLKLVKHHTCFYNSTDYSLHLDYLTINDSRWTDSINFSIKDIVIPCT